MTVKQGKKSYFRRLKRDIKVNPGLYLMSLPAFVLVIVFSYVPLYGILLAFKEYYSALGILGSPWVGWYNFRMFFGTAYFKEILWNTLLISLYSLAVGFPLPIVFALLINSVKRKGLRKVLEVTSYIPYFISVVVMVALILAFFGPSGAFNTLGAKLGFGPIDWLTDPKKFKSLYVWTNIWQGIGWNSIIYSAALSAVDVELYEAATVDGATKFQMLLHIDVPVLVPTTVILLIMAIGGIMNVGYEKIYLMQNARNIKASEIISTYVYKMGLLERNYGFGTAVGLFNSVINFVLLVLANTYARKFSEYSLW